ncbi:FAD-linked oxidoreductase-like protein [Paraphoma chrysanthemicola]|uniref:Proline dehydrogenase n=1 Tax=Paraphoma chrysanthemicola TaxID=798071 RepID=A0A8K0QS20_9PLEO|nr:FAD-linked oxidoreductase-like protein [Paraphoma chrysanthemicola]
MKSRVQYLQRLNGQAIAQRHRALSQTPRYVHQSSQRNVAVPTSPQVHATEQLLSIPTEPQVAAQKVVLGRLPTSTVLRSYLITRMSSNPALLTLCFNILRRMLDSKSWLLNIERNPVLSQILKKTFYAQFCVGEKKDEVVRNTDFARSVLGYDGILFEYALEVLGGAEPTAAETAQEIETWRKGMLQSVEMAKEGDFVGLKWSGLGRHALHLLQARQPATPEMWSAITAACDAAAAKGVSLLPGAEEELTNPGLEAWTLALQKKYNKDRAVVYITYQCYLRNINQRLAQHLATASQEGYVAGVKLVRGAYLTSEPKDVTFDTKEGTDGMYDALTSTVLKQSWSEAVPGPTPTTSFPRLAIVLATHNAPSINLAKSIRASQLSGPSTATSSLPRLTYAQLQGMADEISQELVQDATMKKDHMAKVVKCMTWGSTSECLNFLLRRASENKEAALRTDETRRAMGAELWRRWKRGVGFA